MFTNTRPSLLRFILSGLFLLILPFSIIIYQISRLENGTAIRLPLTVSQTDMGAIVPNAVLATPLNLISRSNIIGDNNFKYGDRIFVFLSPGPNDIWYPYALTKRPPQNGCQNDECLVLRGQITALNDDNLGISYSYENFVAEPQLLDRLNKAHTSDMEITLTVGKDGRAIVRSLHFGTETIHQRKRLIPTLSGLSHKGASAMPAR